MSYLNPDFRELSAADLLAMIEWIDSERSLYGDLIQAVKERFKDELDYRILVFVQHGDAIRENNIGE